LYFFMSTESMIPCVTHGTMPKNGQRLTFFLWHSPKAWQGPEW
jgi:hypothetical protein